MTQHPLEHSLEFKEYTQLHSTWFTVQRVHTAAQYMVYNSKSTHSCTVHGLEFKENLQLHSTWFRVQRVHTAAQYMVYSSKSTQ